MLVRLFAPEGNEYSKFGRRVSRVYKGKAILVLCFEKEIDE